MTARDQFTDIPRDEEDESAGDVMGFESPEPLQGSAVAAPAAEPITAEQWTQILAGRRFRILVKREQIQWAGSRAVRCINCKRAGRAAGGHDPWRAYCLEFACMVSNAFSKLCPAHKAN